MKTSTALVAALVACTLAGIGALACNTVQNAGGQQAHDYGRPHTITSRAESGGSISPLGGTRVFRGSSQTFIATADTGYQVSDLMVDGLSVGAPSYLYHDNSSSYTFNNVGKNHEISALFDVSKSL